MPQPDKRGASAARFAIIGAGVLGASAFVQPPLDEFLRATGIAVLVIAALLAAYRWHSRRRKS